ncbi:DUF930 domain-containing protein [Mesorhizobium sp. WSM4303]|uniref:DUF930 domain-containing protein n=1 Tax=unclassified Mesorhizobium TaxID=325217 RepID=UPI00115ECD65|nr:MULTISPECIES: DUF930 domain-containing protein [unclassified Mesorhizobium]TRC97034.1 DUF930 domain-containing protein [Mesorhizobium sp. WSM4306]TRD05277.1 DUF930 domain-containing protein [Mesorhizobium sp. WSM4303]
MKTETSERRRTFLWALPASLILHALITVLLVYGLPIPAEQPQEEQPVNVALVPPDPPKPKPAPTPPPPQSEAKKPPEQKVEKPAPRKMPPVDVLKPVFQFGDKDTGPRKSLDGSSAQDNAASPAKDGEPRPTAAPKDAESKPVLAPDAGGPTEQTKIDEKPAADKQEAAAPDADKQAAAAATPLGAPGDDGEIELPASAQAPKARPENAPKPSPAKVAKLESGGAERPGSTDAAAARAYAGLPGVRKLYSQGATGDALATTAMSGVPRDQRGAKLCASALDQHLLGASYFPELIPSLPLKAGNVVDAPDVAFRTATTWYHLSYRCEVDTAVTRVLSFDFRVGPPASPGDSALLESSVHR